MSKHKERQIGRIIEATLGLIDDAGLSRLSMSKVADAAGLTRQTVYNYFPDVESIIAQALDAHSRAMEEHLLDLIEKADGVHEKLAAFAGFQLSAATHEHENISLQAGLSAKHRDQLAAHPDAVKAALQASLSAAIGSGAISDHIEPAATVELFWGMVEGAAKASIRHPDNQSYLLDSVIAAMRAVLQAHPPPDRH
jgi:AcrR family transcriptional regulator